jgi:LemA protein
VYLLDFQGKIMKIMILLGIGIACVLGGCDINKHMSDLGFNSGDNVVQKTTNKYNELVDRDEDCNQKWADYQSQLQRRNDLIPQLVGVVKGASAHEETTLIAVTQARANATRPEIQMQEARHVPAGCSPVGPDCKVVNDFEDPDRVARYQQAQGQLGATLSRLMVANENYPQVAALPQFHDLSVTIESTENRILRSREEFNKSVGDFNKDLRHVSGKVINPLTGDEFHARQYFNADANANQAPTVDFGTPTGAGAVQQAHPVQH